MTIRLQKEPVNATITLDGKNRSVASRVAVWIANVDSLAPIRFERAVYELNDAGD